MDPLEEVIRMPRVTPQTLAADPVPVPRFGPEGRELPIRD